MKTIHMTIDELLLEDVDQVIQKLNTTRSAFIREALQLALHRYRINQLEQQHAVGYRKYPTDSGEFDVWVSEQSWGQQ